MTQRAGRASRIGTPSRTPSPGDPRLGEATAGVTDQGHWYFWRTCHSINPGPWTPGGSTTALPWAGGRARTGSGPSGTWRSSTPPPAPARPSAHPTSDPDTPGGGGCGGGCPGATPLGRVLPPPGQAEVVLLVPELSPEGPCPVPGRGPYAHPTSSDRAGGLGGSDGEGGVLRYYLVRDVW